MATVLVSFIGLGQSPREGQERSESGYFLAEYKFPEENLHPAAHFKSTIFGSALLQRLRQMNRPVERWLIMGTDKSIWHDLIDIFPDEIRERCSNEKHEIKKTIDDKKTVFTQEMLNGWQAVLNGCDFNTEIICRIVGAGSDVASQNAIFSAVLDAVQNDDQIVFDVTHGLRNQPIITSFIVMYLRWLRNIKKVDFYYGALDLSGMVVKLDFCRELLEATEAVAIYEQTGNYQCIGEQLNLSISFRDRLRALVFADEMHKTKPDAPKKLDEELAVEKPDFSPLKSSLADKLSEALEWAEKESFAKRLKEKSVSAYTHGQYFKAIASLWEALKAAGCEHFNISNPESHNARERAEKELRDKLKGADEETLLLVCRVRNAILHGSASGNAEVRNAVGNPKEFQKVFNDGVRLVEKILSNQI